MGQTAELAAILSSPLTNVTKESERAQPFLQNFKYLKLFELSLSPLAGNDSGKRCVPTTEHMAFGAQVSQAA